jgi:heme/copper-type cytochrome/quinol oxidase subunit 3
MTRHFIIGAVLVAIVNGIFSPFVLSVFLFYQLWYPSWVPVTTEAVVSVSSILFSTLTLMIAGIPAAIAERVRGKAETDEFSAITWFIGTVVLTLPAVPSMLRVFGAG